MEFVAESIAPPIDESYFREIEEEVGVRFPDSYLLVMKKANGGVPTKQFFPFGENEKVVERFLSFVPDYKTSRFGIYDIEVVWSQIEDRLEEGVCPFAVMFAGDFLCFDGRSGGVKVVIWDHDQAALGGESLVPVADSFDDFLVMLR